MSTEPTAGEAAGRHAPLGDILTRLADADADRPIVTCGEQTVTRAELETRANRLARAYQAQGVVVGDLVTLALPNSIELIAALYALWKLGAIPQPVSSRLPDAELARIVDLADPALVIGRCGMVAGRSAIPPGFVPRTGTSSAPLPSAISPAWKAPTSGGSTGLPKVIVAGQSGAFDVQAAVTRFRLHASQVQLVPAPLYHNAPLTVSTLGMAIGQHVVLMERFDARSALELIKQHHVGFLNLVPTMMLRILRILEQEPSAYDLSSLEIVWHMGGPCAPWLKRRWLEMVGPERLYELYGSTETVAGTTISGQEWLAHPETVGRPAYGEIKIVDVAGHALPSGELGEIAMRATKASPGYRYIGAQARSIGDGWEVFGDLGHLDEDGYLHLSDRRLDMLVMGGANIYPAEVEAAITEHPDVVSCVVVGLPDEDLGERAHAVVEVGGPVEEETLCAFLKARLAPNKVPRSFRFVTTPLQDEAGKVRRSAVREREIEQLQTARGLAHELR
jgi:bile acid-coenzyme A ligase